MLSSQREKSHASDASGFATNLRTIITSLISSFWHSRVALNLQWCDKIKLSKLLKSAHQRHLTGRIPPGIYIEYSGVPRTKRRLLHNSIEESCPNDHV